MRGINLFLAKPPAEPRAPVVRRVKELELITARLIRSGFAGQYHAAFHGRGVEFSQVREYQQGDDIRTIDWNVTARSGVPHVKEFVEERDLAIMVALDVSRSMHFGSVDRRKIDLAVELAAVLSFAALQNGDRVGLTLFNDEVRTFIPPKRGRLHTQAVIRHAIVSGRHLGGTTDFGRGIDFLTRALKRRTVVIFLSDFLGDGFERPIKRLAVRHDVIALRIGDPRENRLPGSGLVRLIDAETGRRRLVDLASNDASRAAAKIRRQVGDSLASSGADVVELSTAIPYERALTRFFESRVGRRR
jgi:uncharacterized protein (DUF58 family)